MAKKSLVEVSCVTEGLIGLSVSKTQVKPSRMVTNLVYKLHARPPENQSLWFDGKIVVPIPAGFRVKSLYGEESEEEEAEKEPIEEESYEDQTGFIRKGQHKDDVQRRDTPENNMHVWYK